MTRIGLKKSVRAKTVDSSVTSPEKSNADSAKKRQKSSKTTSTNQPKPTEPSKEVANEPSETSLSQTEQTFEILALPTPVEAICNSREFNDYVQVLKAIVPNNNNHPILCNILIEAEPNSQQLQLTAYNLEFGMQVSFDATINQPGSLTLPVTILADILGKFPQGRLTINSEVTIPKGNKAANTPPSITATLSMPRSQHVIRGLIASEFPTIPPVNHKLFSLPASTLIGVLKGSLFAVSLNEAKRIITGVNFKLSYDAERGINRLRVWTTDGHRIAMILGLSESNNEANHWLEEAVEFTIPAKVLKLLERNLNPTERVSIYYDGSAEQSAKYVAFRCQNWQMTTQLLEGNYPPCNQIVDPYRSELKYQIIVERLALVRALERLATHSDKSHVTVGLEFDSEQQQIRASITNAVSSGQEIIAAKIDGDNLRVKLDIRYLIDTVKAVTTSDLRMLLASPLAPVLIVPFGTPVSGEAAIESEYAIAPQE